MKASRVSEDPTLYTALITTLLLPNFDGIRTTVNSLVFVSKSVSEEHIASRPAIHSSSVKQVAC